MLAQLLRRYGTGPVRPPHVRPVRGGPFKLNGRTVNWSRILEPAETVCLRIVLLHETDAAVEARTKLGDKVVVHVRGLVAPDAPTASPQHEHVFLDTRKAYEMGAKSGARPGLALKLGSDELIGAWNHGLLDMAVGERRRLLVPPSWGFGARGYARWKIPPDSDVVFDVELLSIG